MRPAWQRAIDEGNVAMVRALLDEGADIEARDRHGQTALLRAAARGHLDVVRLLMERGASLDVSAKYHLTAVMLAVVGLHSEVALALIDAGADPALRGSGAPGFAGLTVLDLARARGLSNVVEALEGRQGGR